MVQSTLTHVGGPAAAYAWERATFAQVGVPEGIDTCERSKCVLEAGQNEEP